MSASDHTRRQSPDITQLVLHAQKGSEQAFSELYKAYFPQIYYYTLKRLRSDDLASEATQATFLGVCTNLNQLKSPQAFRFWIFRIAQRAVNLVRQESEHGGYYELPLVDDDSAGQSAGVSDLEDHTVLDPETSFEMEEVHNALFTGINRLPDQQREAIILFYFAGFNIAEIAQITGIKAGAMRKRLFDARAELRRLFVAPLDTIVDETPAARAERQKQRQTLAAFFERDLRELDFESAQTQVTTGLAAALPLAFAHMDKPAMAVARAQSILRQASGIAQRSSAPQSAEHIAQLGQEAASAQSDAFLSGIENEKLILQGAARKIALAVAAVLVLAAGLGVARYFQLQAGRNARNVPTATPPVQPETPTASIPATSTSLPSSNEATPAPRTTPAPTPKPGSKSTPAPRTTPAPKATPTPAVPAPPTITVLHTTLTYPMGTSVPAAKILVDAGARARSADGSKLPVTLAAWNTIDFMHPGTAQVYVRAQDGAGLARSVVISVTITSSLQ